MNMKATVRRRELGTELRKVRESTGMTLNELARNVGWDPSKLSRIEHGKLPCTEIEAAILLGYCRVAGNRLDEVVALCSGDVDGTWLRQNGGIPDQLRTLVMHEACASAIYALELNRIDGLLQTEDYARELMRGAGLVPEHGIPPRVRARLERQTLLRRADPPSFVFYMHEQVLHLPVGSDQIMHEQMLHLLFLADRPRCVIRILPTEAGPHAGLGGPFRVMQYVDQQSVVCLETQNRSLFLESSVDIATYWLILAKLAEVALTAQESRSVLAAAVSRYDRVGVRDHGDPDGLAQEQLQR
ncbi:helix-turn-helix transcriptional regulator [Actinokineospora sp. NBRC 105648]|uniref:helix-turn-helix domain-containing protein n=1 Tax=Actinokineospora sp. NBRC 105648 TaxID=3032206 RepID=UPI0024A53D08|nr:helix-turn-helix transcriptional regulator [Actinokineospora sp. NBRC 105648]GLZ40119.1 transcriptional regulator [Actinokineospora sp. NBRC 105648]